MSTALEIRHDYVAGWLDSSIHDFLAATPPRMDNARYALITSLDSNADPGSMISGSPELRYLAANVRTLGKGLLLPTKMLLQNELGNRIFYGFDEVWFFPNSPTEPKPEAASLVGPARIDNATLERLGQWMSRCSCSLALGDGGGLNFIVKARGLGKLLLAHSLQQPEPDAISLEAADSA